MTTNDSADILEDGILKGFEFVPSDGVPFITLDKERRFYLNSSARKLVGVRPYDRVSIAYNVAESALAIVKNAEDIHAEISQYFVDKRYYMSARKFSRHYAFAPEAAPYEFVYDRGSSDGRVFIFRLKQD